MARQRHEFDSEVDRDTDGYANLRIPVDGRREVERVLLGDLYIGAVVDAIWQVELLSTSADRSPQLIESSDALIVISRIARATAFAISTEAALADRWPP